ncbi:MAG: TrkH family potassium uptake protein [Lachnospiraceae bacterium]|nr:TrkH family potassium uptake protein [Lachnospiraceae bacterium]
MNYSFIVYILGWVLTLEAGFMVLPCVTSLIYREKTGLWFLLVAAVSALVGFLLIRKKPKNPQFFTKEGFAVVGLSWIAMSLVGALPFTLSKEIPNYIDAVFETASGFTTTGASILTDVEALSHTALIWRSFTHWIGGMGVFIFLLAILPMAGGYNMHLMRAESPGPSVGKLVPKVKESAKILYIIYLSITVAEMVLLIIARMPVFDAICMSFGTAGTGGFGIRADSCASYNAVCQWIITIFMALFGINFNFYFFIIRKRFKDAFTIEEVRWYVALILLSTALVTFNTLRIHNGVGVALRTAAFQVSSIITTTGFATVDFNLWPSLSKTILIILMLTGACAGSTGGGLKISRFIIWWKSIKNEIEVFIHPRSVKAVEMDGKTIEKDTVRSVSVYMVVFLLVYMISVFLISLDKFDMVTNFTAILATINNIGPGLGEVGPCGGFSGFSYFSKIVIIFDMLAGRLELYPMLLLLTPGVWKKN